MREKPLFPQKTLQSGQGRLEISLCKMIVVGVGSGVIDHFINLESIRLCIQLINFYLQDPKWCDFCKNYTKIIK